MKSGRTRGDGGLRPSSPSPQAAFSLIELLVVVAIIALLAAMAVPNLLEAQTRAKVVRVKSDLRALATAAEAYLVDHKRLPPNSEGPLGGMTPGDITRWALPLSTPVAYISSAHLLDPFGNADALFTRGQAPYIYISCEPKDPLAALLLARAFPEDLALQERVVARRYFLLSGGPDGRLEFQRLGSGLNGLTAFVQASVAGLAVYDPTNGTASVGDIIRTRKGDFRPDH